MKRLAVAAAWALPACGSFALTNSTYSTAANDRFSSGFPSAPVENTSGSFVGAGLDWGGVGWASTLASKGFGFLSPKHYLVARHYGGAANIRIFAGDTLQTYSQAGIENTGYGVVFSGQTLGDLSMGTLTTSIPESGGMPRYAVLDLNSSSTNNSNSAYNGLSVLLYGKGATTTSSPRIGEAVINSVTNSGNNHYFTTSRTDVQLQDGDSGSPAIHRWTNPDGQNEITLIGNNAGIGGDSNFLNFLGTYQVMNKLNEFMNDDGFALRVVGNPSATWVGSSSSNINLNLAWGIGKNPNDTGGTSDKFVLFDSATASTRNVNVNANYNLRGLYFKSTAEANDGFTFGGSSTLTVGRGGVVNYDNDRQVFNAPLALGDAQYWDGGSGGITVAGTLNTAGKMLEITGTGTNRITGQISGTGSLALSGGSLELTASNTYSGTTWVHAGQLLVNNTTGSATGSGTVNIAPGGVLSGTGALSGNVVVSGIVAPGNSIGTLTAGGQLTWHSGDDWLFELATAGTTLAAAKAGESEQDRLDIGKSFLKGAGSEWSFNFAGTGDLGWYRLITWNAVDGTTFLASDFSAYNLANDYTGSFTIDDGGLYVNVVPEPTVVSLIALIGIFTLGIRIWRRRL